MTQQTALDEFVRVVQGQWSLGQSSANGLQRNERIDSVAYCMAIWDEKSKLRFSQVLQDPRYLAYCKE